MKGETKSEGEGRKERTALVREEKDRPAGRNDDEEDGGDDGGRRTRGK